MQLFGKKKESEDAKQTQEVKAASNETLHSSNLNEMPQSVPSSNLSLGNTNSNPVQTNNQIQTPNSNFNNNLNIGNSNNQMNATNQAINNPNPFAADVSQNMNSNYPNSNLFNTQPNTMMGNQAINSNNNNNDVNSNPFGQTNVQSNLQNNSLDLAGQMQDQNIGPVSKDEVQQMVDELVEQVIEERWTKLVEKVEKVATWKEKQEQHINLIKEDIVSMKDAFDKLEKRILTKISDYDKNVLDVNSEIKALEKVFQKITPTLVNNVNELSKIATNLKGDNKPKKLLGDGLDIEE